MLHLFGVTLLFNIVAYSLVRLRPRIFGTVLFKPMIWNMFLSILPTGLLTVIVLARLGLGLLSSYHDQFIWILLANVVLALGLVAWFLLLPNSGYLVTELNLTHREVDKVQVPIWYDIVAVFDLALSGILNMVLNIGLLQLLVIIIVDPSAAAPLPLGWFWGLTGLSFLLMSFGIYMGRYIRFNTWDLLHPVAFVKRFGHYFQDKSHLFSALGFTFLYGLLFAMMYGLTFYGPIQQLLK